MSHRKRIVLSLSEIEYSELSTVATEMGIKPATIAKICMKEGMKKYENKEKAQS